MVSIFKWLSCLCIEKCLSAGGAIVRHGSVLSGAMIIDVIVLMTS